MIDGLLYKQHLICLLFVQLLETKFIHIAMVCQAGISRCSLDTIYIYIH